MKELSKEDLKHVVGGIAGGGNQGGDPNPKKQEPAIIDPVLATSGN
jgi:bacteriocin-like protein